MALDNTLLYCRSCKRKINSEAKVCPQCGAKDPFYLIGLGRKMSLLSFVIGLILGVGFAGGIIAAFGTKDILYLVLAIAGGIGLYRLGAVIAFFILQSEAEKIKKVVDNEYGYNYSDTEAVEKWRELYDKAMTPTLERIFN
ncbi:MAG: hypothetical protein K6G08_09615 [Prevotella sp.]|nr:hypothetical protein [Prevotella sp.]